MFETSLKSTRTISNHHNVKDEVSLSVRTEVSSLRGMGLC